MRILFTGIDICSSLKRPRDEQIMYFLGKQIKVVKPMESSLLFCNEQIKINFLGKRIKVMDLLENSSHFYGYDEKSHRTGRRFGHIIF